MRDASRRPVLPESRPNPGRDSGKVEDSTGAGRERFRFGMHIMEIEGE